MTKLQQIVDRFPGSREAGIARDRLTRRRASTGASSPANGASSPARIAAPAPQPGQRDSVQPSARPSGPLPSTRTDPTGDATTRRGSDDFKLSVGDRIFFDAASARIEPRQRRVLVAQAAWLKIHPSAMLKLEGHADDPGGRELNEHLSAERTEAVRVILLKEGIGSERIESEAVGNARPLVQCDAGDTALREACAAQNRRVVSVVGWGDAFPRRRLGATSSEPQGALASPALAPDRSTHGPAPRAIPDGQPVQSARAAPR